MRRMGIVAISLTALVVWPAAARAATITLDFTDGIWTDADPGLTTTIDNTGAIRTLRWGTGGRPSGYDFTPITDSFTVSAEGSPFLLGTFVHHNNPIYGLYLSSASLQLAIGWPDLSSLLIGTIAFVHDETRNNAPCPYGGLNGEGVNEAGCADRVLVSAPSISQLISYGGYTYVFTLLGFSTDGGLTISDEFLTMEGMQNAAGLYGTFTLASPVIVNPEPASLVLLGTGLAALAYHRRHRKKNRSS